MNVDGKKAAELAAIANPLEGGLDRLVEAAGRASYVLIGESTHGTREFYEVRADLTRRLIREHGFTVIALEADWPDTIRMHHFAEGTSADRDAVAALGDFERFPRWLWRNDSMLPFLEWLREWNRPLAEDRVGIFGMDLYSLHASMRAVVEHLEKSDPDAAARARERFACFDYFGQDPHAYGYLTTRQGEEPCEDEVVAQLVEMRRRNLKDATAGEDGFFALQNAKVVANAERYYRAMFRGRGESWNHRDAHMEDTVRALARHYHAGDTEAKVIVWAHNSHVSDARATELGRRGEWSLGQLLRERLASRVFSIGFSTFAGTVTAARKWGGEPEEMELMPGFEGGYEDLFHRLGLEAFWLDLGGAEAGIEVLRPSRLQRAIGVIYRPRTEWVSHYFKGSLPRQFDAIIHIDTTTAVNPLDAGRASPLDLPASDPAARV